MAEMFVAEAGILVWPYRFFPQATILPSPRKTRLSDLPAQIAITLVLDDGMLTELIQVSTTVPSARRASECFPLVERNITLVKLAGRRKEAPHWIMLPSGMSAWLNPAPAASATAP